MAIGTNQGSALCIGVLDFAHGRASWDPENAVDGLTENSKRARFPAPRVHARRGRSQNQLKFAAIQKDIFFPFCLLLHEKTCNS